MFLLAGVTYNNTTTEINESLNRSKFARFAGRDSILNNLEILAEASQAKYDVVAFRRLVAPASRRLGYGKPDWVKYRTSENVLQFN